MIKNGMPYFLCHCTVFLLFAGYEKEREVHKRGVKGGKNNNMYLNKCWWKKGYEDDNQIFLL